MHCNTIIVIRDFKVADYGWLRRLDVSSELGRVPFKGAKV